MRLVRDVTAVPGAGWCASSTGPGGCGCCRARRAGSWRAVRRVAARWSSSVIPPAGHGPSPTPTPPGVDAGTRAPGHRICAAAAAARSAPSSVRAVRRHPHEGAAPGCDAGAARTSRHWPVWPVAEVWGPAAADGGERRPGPPSARVVVGTEAALHRVRDADAVVFLEFDSELLAPRFRAAEQALALLARAARLVSRRRRCGRRRPGPGSCGRPDPPAPSPCPRRRRVGRSRRARRRGVRGASGPRPSPLQRAGGGVGPGRRRLRRRPCGPPRPTTVEVSGPVDGSVVGAGARPRRAVRPPGGGAPAAGSAPGRGRPGAVLSAPRSPRVGRGRGAGRRMPRYHGRHVEVRHPSVRRPRAAPAGGRGRRHRRDAQAARRRHGPDHVRGTRRGPGRAPGRCAEAHVRLRHRRRRRARSPS